MNLCYLSKTVGFEAAYYPQSEDPEISARLHGHSFTLEGTLKTDSDDAQAAHIDFATMSQCLLDLAAQLDHSLLNDFEELSDPSLMQLCNWVVARLQPVVATLHAVTIRIAASGEQCRLEIVGR